MQTVTGYVVSIVVFCVLLGASYLVLRRVPPRYTTDTSKKEEIDQRVVHFTLRLALTFGIGAVIVGVLLVAALLVL